MSKIRIMITYEVKLLPGWEFTPGEPCKGQLGLAGVGLVAVCFKEMVVCNS